MPSKLKKAIGAVKDQTSISLAKVVSSNTCSNLEVSVLKATTHDDVPIDDKYVSEVLQIVSSNKVHAAACARAIGKRIGRTRNWVVALKSLMLVLRIFQDADPYFPREVLHAMKRGAKILNLSGFRDDSNSSPWDFTAFVRTFALYLDERLECFLTGKLQRRYKNKELESWSYHRRQSRKANEPVHDMKPAMLVDKISYWQRLLDRAIGTRPTGAAKTNRLVHISVYAVVQESFELYKDISDGLSLLLDSFFHLQHQNCVSAFQACIKASKQYQELSSFYDLCKSIGVGRTSEYPSVQTISEELIETLQEFLKDQSSFSCNAKPANKLLLLPAPSTPSIASRSARHDSYGGQSEFSVATSGFSKRSSEFGSQCTSLEDLISATESGISPAISIDLEAYSDQFDKPSQRDDAFRISDSCSTRSLPVSNSMADLVSLSDWSEQDEKEQDLNQQEQNQPISLDYSISKNWELVLAETMSSTSACSSKTSNGDKLDAFIVQKTDADISKNGSELVLFDTAPSKNNHYNPFLQDLEPSSVQLSTTVAPKFQETPTFSAQNSNQESSFSHNENDPFNAFSGEHAFSTSTNQHNLQHEQQLWLQNQNKIIAKHMV
ncbi:clathrin coat assembly protein AP180-like [Primulina tabacum]|uniref:clathrin coat assembly protein AP180-like n=1 Tax=Primulina tabacum TaxID=48773 RepID=UPI003F5A200D